MYLTGSEVCADVGASLCDLQLRRLFLLTRVVAPQDA